MHTNIHWRNTDIFIPISSDGFAQMLHKCQHTKETSYLFYFAREFCLKMAAGLSFWLGTRFPGSTIMLYGGKMAAKTLEFWLLSKSITNLILCAAHCNLDAFPAWKYIYFCTFKWTTIFQLMNCVSQINQIIIQNWKTYSSSLNGCTDMFSCM